MSKETRELVVKIAYAVALALVTAFAGSTSKSAGDLEMTVRHMARVQEEMLAVMLRNNVPVAGPELEEGP